MMNREIIQKLIDKQLTVVTIESVTGGLLADAFVSVSGVSNIYMGGFITYQPESKVKWLGIDHDQLNQFGTVSKWAVLAMLKQGLNHTQANLALAVTGNAGPTTDGSGEVGDFYIGVMDKNHEQTRLVQLNGTRQERRHMIIAYLEKLLNDFLSTYY